MKWIVILTTLFAFTAANSYADEDMPIGDTSQASGWGAGAEASSSPTAKTKPRTKKPIERSTERSADYTPAQDLLLSAMSLIGVKYTWGGNTPESGLDCSGFIRYVFQNSMNMTLPRTAFEMAQTGRTVDKTELKPGDLVFFNTLGRTFSHVGIYLGDNRFIHSPRAGRSVEVANMGQSYWTTRFTGARRMADGGSEGLNINAMLANSSNESKRVTTSASASINNVTGTAARSVCKKVTTGKGKKRKTVMECSRVSSTPAKVSKSASTTTRSKAATSSHTSKVTKTKTSSTKKTSTKAPAKSTGKAAVKSSSKTAKPVAKKHS